MTDPVEIGIQGQRPKYAFMIKDEYSGLKHMFALHAKSTETHQQAISFLLGQKRCIQIHSDNSSEIMNAAANLGMPHSHAESGVPQTTLVAERANADVL